jgi:D-xylonolactonase
MRGDVSVEFETVMSGLGMLEAPRVDDDGTLYWSDIYGGVHRLAPDGRHDRLLADRVGTCGLVLDESGGLVVSGREEPLACWDPVSDTTRVLATELDGVRIPAVNDIQADEHGSVWAGTYDVATFPASTDEARAFMFGGGLPGVLEEPRGAGRSLLPACLLRVDPDGSVTKLWEEGTAANGLGFSPDGSILYQNDTAEGLFAYDVTADRRLRHRRFFGRVPEGHHNGLAVDAEGGVWVASTGGGTITRFRPDAVIDQVIAVPARFVMSLTFGGADLRDVYVVTCDNLEHPQRYGTVFRSRSEVPGLRSPKARLV